MTDTPTDIPKEIMTVKEVAHYLRLNEMTVYRLARTGEIPGWKIGNAWRFSREIIEERFKEAAREDRAGCFTG